MTKELDMLTSATRKYERAKKAYETAKTEAIDAALTALRAGERPTDVAAASPFTPAYIRRLAREAGIEPAAPGPKPSRSDQ